MLLKQLIDQLIAKDLHLPLPDGTTHVVIANDISMIGLGRVYSPAEAIAAIEKWIYPFPSPMDVLYYRLEYDDIAFISSRLELTKDATNDLYKSLEVNKGNVLSHTGL